MRLAAIALPLSALLLTALSSPLALAAPSSSTKEGAAASSPERDAALRTLVEGEAMLEDQATLADGMSKMFDAYVVLEQTDGAEARGVKELRSWIVKALETLGGTDEAAELRARGSYVDHPLSVMPSTWFPQNKQAASAGQDGAGLGPEAGAALTYEQAAALFEQGLEGLQAGDIEGLVEVIDAYEALEAAQGPESEDAVLVRSFLVGFLEAGGFTDEATLLRERGSVTPASDEDTLLYQKLWLDIIEKQEGTVLGGGSVSSKDLKSDQPAQPTQPAELPTDPSDSSELTEPDDEADGSRPSVDFEAGSVVPSVLVDLGLGSFQPDLGKKGLLWTLGMELQWTLFSAGPFSMVLGGAGQFGRNRDKRWLTDAWGAVGFDLDFQRVYVTPEFGGGYDGIAGGDDTLLTEAMRVGHAPYYHFGGTLGARLGERLGLYARAVRVNRDLPEIRNETRARGGVIIWLEDEGAIDVAFSFTDYQAPKVPDVPEGEPMPVADPSARLFSGHIGFRF